MSGTTEGEPTTPGEEGEMAAGKGEPTTANPYPTGSDEGEEWLDGYDYVVSADTIQKSHCADSSSLEPAESSAE
jgi:hypothetical protein